MAGTALIIADIDKHYPALDPGRRSAELIRELISRLIMAVVSYKGLGRSPCCKGGKQRGRIVSKNAAPLQVIQCCALRDAVSGLDGQIPSQIRKIRSIQNLIDSCHVA